jgi:hypothetical protein
MCTLTKKIESVICQHIMSRLVISLVRYEQVEPFAEAMFDSLHPEAAMAILRSVQERQRARSIRRIGVITNVLGYDNAQDAMFDRVSLYLYRERWEDIYDGSARHPERDRCHHPMLTMMAAYLDNTPDVLTLGAGMTYRVETRDGSGEEYTRITYGQLQEVPELTAYDIRCFVVTSGIGPTHEAWDRLWDLVRECLV